MQEYTKTDQHIHYVSQTLAKYGRSFSEPQTDDSHTNLGFDFAGKRIWARWAFFGDKKIALTLDLDDQEFVLMDSNYKAIASFTSVGKTLDAVEQEIAKYLSINLKANGSDLLKELHYQIPDYGFTNEKIGKWNDKAVHMWMQYRQEANQACKLLADHLNMNAEIRIWPHHFDTGIYLEPTNKLGIGFGLAMADTMIDEAYFYFSVYGLNGNSIDYSTVPSLTAGTWITGENWNGAVLPVREVSTNNMVSLVKDLTLWAL